MPQPTADVEVEVVLRESDKAILCRLATDREVWIPRSVIANDVLTNGEGGTLEVHEWFALKEGLV